MGDKKGVRVWGHKTPCHGNIGSGDNDRMDGAASSVADLAALFGTKACVQLHGSARTDVLDSTEAKCPNRAVFGALFDERDEP